jgi:hypothetical protein
MIMRVFGTFGCFVHKYFSHRLSNGSRGGEKDTEIWGWGDLKCEREAEAPPENNFIFDLGSGS